ncbi:MAG: Saccharopine dehydrogenase [Gammaproteobacteria bacterium]|nr:Saccharopine dehydrogenase [Gammaproteobacteria bacterium]
MSYSLINGIVSDELAMALKRILILGGYGNFGKRIAEGLANQAGAEIIIAGRNLALAEQIARELAKGKCLAKIQAVSVDIQNPDFQETLVRLAPGLVIHTAGPFQGQDYKVPLACIAAGCHYLDLADDRRFVCDIVTLHEQARQKNVLIVSGASSVPGLSSTVVDLYRNEFSQIDKIDFCIVPGNKTERGVATIQGILSYTGHAYRVYTNGAWKNTYGWLSPRRLDIGGALGKRWLANVDIPDLELFPSHYAPVRTVRFQAGLELAVLHWAMVIMALLARSGLVRNWANYVKPIYSMSNLFNGFGTDTGGMQILIRGIGHDKQMKSVKWTLVAKNGIGPYVPTLSVIILAKKLMNGELSYSGAMPCLGMYTLEEFDQIAAGLGIYHTTEITTG